MVRVFKPKIENGKTKIINDLLGQPNSPAGSDFRGGTDGRTDNTKDNRLTGSKSRHFYA